MLGDEYCYGIFADNTYKTTFDFGYENTDYYFVEHEKGELDYYFMPGNDMAEVVGLYTSLTGTTPLYQRWIYGSHQSRWGYYTQDEVLDIADKFRELDIPCDVIHMDIDYMNGYRVFTFDDKKFPDVKGLSEKLADRGVKLISIIDPGVKRMRTISCTKREWRWMHLHMIQMAVYMKMLSGREHRYFRTSQSKASEAGGETRQRYFSSTVSVAYGMI